MTKVKHGWVDNYSLRLAVERGSSQKLAHLRKSGGVNLNFLAKRGIEMRRVDTAANEAAIFTKVLGAARLQHLLRRTFALKPTVPFILSG